jgi:hypothetical protein
MYGFSVLGMENKRVSPQQNEFFTCTFGTLVKFTSDFTVTLRIKLRLPFRCVFLVKMVK